MLPSKNATEVYLSTETVAESAANQKSVTLYPAVLHFVLKTQDLHRNSRDWLLIRDAL
jgi:hypothetical protein